MAIQKLDHAETERRVQALQEKGLVDLDAPLREVIPTLARTIVTYRAGASWWIIASGDNPHAVCECEW
jgi:hypothetical protein